VIHFCRVVRWGILLESAGKVGFWKLNSVGAVGFMALVVLPFRLGEFARPLLIAEKGRIRRSAAMASVVVERVVDGIAMTAVLLIAVFFADFGPSTDGGRLLAQVRFWGLVILAGFVGALVFLVIAYVKRDLARRILHSVVEPLSARLAHKVSDMLDAFIGGLKVVPHRGKVVLFFALTIVYWGINALGMLLVAKGFNLSLTMAQALAVLGVLVIGVMIPAGPGMLGTFQGAVVIGMKLCLPGPEHEGAIQAYAWLIWACQFGQQALTGLVFLFSGHIKFGQLLGGPPEDDG
jgi:glycosyltransferase 2 family protein